MEEEVHKTRSKKNLSQSYNAGIKRLSGRLDDPDEDDFVISEEVLKSRELSWAMLFKKFMEDVSDDREVIYTMGSGDESQKSGLSEIRYPVRKTVAQIEYWIKTGRAPCQAVDSESSDTDATMSINETETELDESRCSSMVVNKKLMDSCAENVITNESSSATSVDTATYIRNNANTSLKQKQKDSCSSKPGLVNNNRVNRSIINAALPRVLITRLEDSSPKPKIHEEILNKSTNVESGLDRKDEITHLYGENIVESKNDEDLNRNPENRDIKASEVTFESKEPVLGSLAIGDRKNLETSKKQKVASGQKRRKLYTGDDCILDVLSTAVGSIQKAKVSRKNTHPALATPTIAEFKKKRRRVARNSIHPALDPPTPADHKRKRSSYRPKLLIIPRALAKRRKTENLINKSYAKDKRNKNKSMISKSELAKIFDKNSDLIGAFTDVKENLDNLDKSKEKDEEKEVPARVSTESLPKIEKNAFGVANASSSSLSLNDVSQIINEEINKSPEARQNDLIKKSSVEQIEKTDSKRDGVDQGSIFKPPVKSVSKTVKSRMRDIMNVKKNLYATDLRSSVDSDSPAASMSDSLDLKKDDQNCTSLKKRSIESLQNPMLVSTVKECEKNCTLSKKRSIESLPIENLNLRVILHDFKNRKSCCTKQEEENYEIWLRTQKRPKTEEEKIDSPTTETSLQIETRVESKEATKHEASAEVEPKLVTKKKTNFNRNDTSSESLSSKIKNADQDLTPSFNNGHKNSSESKPEELSKSVITKNSKSHWEQFLEHSSDDDYILERKEKRKQLNSVDGRETKIVRSSDKSVSTSSENEKIGVEAVSNILKPEERKSKHSERNKAENSSSESGLTILSIKKDTNLYKPTGMVLRDKRSSGNNKPLDTKKTEEGKSSILTRSKEKMKSNDSVSPKSSSKVNVESDSNEKGLHKREESSESELTILSLRKKDKNLDLLKNMERRDTKVEKRSTRDLKPSATKKTEKRKSLISTRSKGRTNSDDSLSPIFSKVNDALNLNGKKNDENSIMNSLKTPVDQATNSQPKRLKNIRQNNSVATNDGEAIEKARMSPRSARIEFNRRIRRMMSFTDSQEEEEEDVNLKVFGPVNSGEGKRLTNRQTHLPRIDESLNKEETTTSISMTYNTANNISLDKSWKTSLIDDSTVTNDISSRTRKKRRKKRSTSSTIVYRTKEFWETDSDKS